MYTLKLLPEAINDMTEIVKYISTQLHNPAAATRLKEKITVEIKRLPENPYICAVFSAALPTKFEYRRLLVKNYAVLYYIDENEKAVKIARVIYAKRNLSNILE